MGIAHVRRWGLDAAERERQDRIDLAHERDLRLRAKEQLLLDVSVEDAREEVAVAYEDDYDF